MILVYAVILGIVEGLTEFLPVSSTGHLIITRHLFDMPDDAIFRSLDVIIQSGAVLAVLWHYKKLLLEMLSQKRQLFVAVVIGFLPAAILGVLLHSWIKEKLFAPLPVVCALVVGGVLMVIIERKFPAKVKGPEAQESVEQLEVKFSDALKIGLFQCVAMWPGTSRSMMTILGARMLGFHAKKAAEFSFLLAIPTLLGASVLDFYKHGQEILALPEARWAFVVGIASAFVVALVVIRSFLKFLEKHSLEVFGWYRIIVGIILYFMWS